MPDLPDPQPTPQFDVDVTVTPVSARLTLAGELDIASVGRLRAAIDDVIGSSAPEVRIDVSALRFTDAAGIGELIRARVALAAAGRRLTLERVRAGLERTLRLAEADWLID